MIIKLLEENIKNIVKSEYYSQISPYHCWKLEDSGAGLSKFRRKTISKLLIECEDKLNTFQSGKISTK